MADQIDEAAELSIGIALTLLATRDYGHTAELFESCKPEADRLHDLLKLPDVGGEMSLANQFPVDIAGEFYPSYAAGIVDIVTRRGVEVIQLLDTSLSMNCAKEYERATQRPCNMAAIVARRSRKAAPPCKKCGGGTRVGSTQGRIRYIYCKDSQCGHSFSESIR